MSNPCDVLPFNVDQKTGSSPTVLRKDHDVILAVPLHVGLALPILHGGPPAPRGLPQGGTSHFHAGNGRAVRSLTARGRGFKKGRAKRVAWAGPYVDWETDPVHNIQQ